MRPFPLPIGGDGLAGHAQQPTADFHGFQQSLGRRVETGQIPAFQFLAEFLKGRLDRLIHGRIGPRFLADGADLGEFMKLLDGRREVGRLGQPRQFLQKPMHIVRHHAGQRPASGAANPGSASRAAGRRANGRRNAAAALWPRVFAPLLGDLLGGASSHFRQRVSSRAAQQMPHSPRRPAASRKAAPVAASLRRPPSARSTAFADRN